ncbi:MAG: penicillin-binding protein 2 [Brevundimonas sp.]|uniref:peptidoglycan D,D-transpeptidase FtsI family protein n=1 Tax=Brevundimonas sp. TaxID=1871086 RepID=UPI00271859F3|nr:penicillin-binding protein 2 [Brevundimonas sp.]MDO9588119.1 penicillin-binding protein 2 [Brevundimonas sp.]MDP3368282.1 penicillin-binding protein 2 [Brevundimonas sp.]MDP3655406.1 penicillin-binding protein 2 [Brevundimonas sp.]
MWWVEHAFGRAHADARPEEDTRVRIFVVLAAFSFVFVCLTLGAAHAALLTAGGGRGAASHPDAVVRADMIDRNGALLATNIVHYGLYIDPAQVWDRPAAAAQIRRALPRVSRTRLDNALNGDRRLLVVNRLTPQEKAAVHALALGGVGFEPEDVRVYPLGGSARHVVGGVDTGGQGLSAAERAFNDEIRAAGARGETFQVSIDLRVQGVLENELAAAAEAVEAKGAVGIITDVQTGEVLGMASWPAANSRNLASAATYEMGSVFKTFTVAAAIDTGRADMTTLLDASESLQIGRRRINDFHAQNRVMTLEEVYLHSSNIGTSLLATQMGPRVMRDYFGRFGLLDPAPFEIPSERPIVPRDWSDSTLASLSFGYGVSVTPLQVAAAMAALTNGGRYIPLTLRKGGLPNARARQVVSPETSLILLDLMRRNVASGSGGRAEAAGLRVGGKTGSANKSVNGRYSTAHAVGTFAGVFPADGPVNARRYQILVLIDEPQTYPRTGGFVAAPAVGRIADRIAPFLGVERRADPWRTAVGDRVPAFEDVEGDGR